MLAQVLAHNSSLFGETIRGIWNPSATTAIDLSPQNTALQGLDLSDTPAFCRWLDSQLCGKIGAGGYLEHRDIYRRSAHFDGNSEARSLHLGIDIWTAAGTLVFCPFDGIIHSFRDNSGFGDYGPTLVLEHRLDEIVFYTLYGHLSRASLNSLQKGKAFKTGDKIGTLGAESENGSWPPHLHFQIIRDMNGYEGDFPGVAQPSERSYFESLCPDPNLVLKCRLFRPQ